MTVRSPLWDGIAIGIGFLIILTGTGGVAVVLAAIGTVTKDETRPVLVVRAWLVAREAAVMSWWRARRAPLLGLLFPPRGRHAIPDWHPLDEEDDDERANDGHDSGRAAVPDGGGGGRPDAPGDLHLPGASGSLVPSPMRGVRPDVGSDESRAENDDLTGLSAEDTDTLRIFHEANEEHLVPSHEPDVPRQDVTGDGPDNAAGRQHDGPPHASNPGEASLPDGAPEDPPDNVPAHTGRGPGDDPGPDGPPDTTPPCEAAVASGPGHQPEDPPGPEWLRETSASETSRSTDAGPGDESPGPAERGVISGSDGPVPARLPAGPGDTLDRLICTYQHAAEELLPAWESMLADHIAARMATLRAVTGCA